MTILQHLFNIYFHPLKTVTNLLRIERLEADIELYKLQAESAKADLREVVASVAIIHSSGSGLISKDAYVRMTRGGVV
jgi:hypothetical protein